MDGITVHLSIPKDDPGRWTHVAKMFPSLDCLHLVPAPQCLVCYENLETQLLVQLLWSQSFLSCIPFFDSFRHLFNLVPIIFLESWFPPTAAVDLLLATNVTINFGITFKTVKGTNFHLHTQKEKTQLVGGDRAQGNS